MAHKNSEFALPGLAKSFRNHVKTARRVWDQTKNGWTSREVTNDDVKHWESLADLYETGVRNDREYFGYSFSVPVNDDYPTADPPIEVPELRFE